jgi:hypothetical protein
MPRHSTLRLLARWSATALFAACSAGLPASDAAGTSTEATIATGFSQAAGLSAWQMPFPQDWELRREGSFSYLHMNRPREPGVPRRPLQFALLKNVDAASFTLDVLVRRAQGSMMVVFDYVDTLHFYYVHLSMDPGVQQPVHNGIFLVDAAPRRRLAGVEATPALPDLAWHDVRIVRNAPSGSIQVFLDKEATPRFQTMDRTFTHGQVGLGSFDETGDFARFRLRVGK